ncbi:response regulator transcription factor [Streptomyces phyllanthi]|uniref:Response regulator transcription factor n=1 Tax=Streptomyces phyllanthi TaxID=1803180 RepID=A0A5N8W6B2_9ACTN|nr:response regulator transcription factor [Streptomyces phyllanthi]MPY41888.1 response regulator transcription factor [Streptomyces phyllanthi]
MIKVGVLGRRPLERAGARRTLEEDGRVRIVGEGTLDHASHIVRTTRPDILVTLHPDADDALSELSALRSSRTTRTTDAAPAPRRIVLVGKVSEDAARKLLHLGAQGILLSGDALEHLSWAVRAAAAGSIALAPTVARSVVDQYARPGPPAGEAAAARIAWQARGSGPAQTAGTAGPLTVQEHAGSG